MSPAASSPSCEDVLDAFSVEPKPDRKTLERYLRTYPDYAEDLIDLARELSRDPCDDEEPFSAEDRALLDAAWHRHAAEAPNVVADPFAMLSTAHLREIAQRLEVPRQVIAAFRERRVIPTSVPRRFLTRLAEAVNTSVDTLEVLWSDLAPMPTVARSYKAHTKPTAVEPVSFERLLIDAGVPQSKRTELMSDAD